MSAFSGQPNLKIAKQIEERGKALDFHRLNSSGKHMGAGNTELKRLDSQLALENTAIKANRLPSNRR
jgi:hypothetical protein